MTLIANMQGNVVSLGLCCLWGEGDVWCGTALAVEANALFVCGGYWDSLLHDVELRIRACKEDFHIHHSEM